MPLQPVPVTYHFKNSVEHCLTTREQQKHCVLFTPPLFEESNILRRLLVEAMRILSEQYSIASLLPDLPGTLESYLPPEQADITLWQEAMMAVHHTLGPATHIASLRSGCAIRDFLPQLPCWRLTPVSGWQHLRTLARAQLASQRESGENVPKLSDMLNQAELHGGYFAGYNVGATLVKQLKNTKDILHNDDYIARLIGDPKPAQSYIDGSPLWLRAEPDHDAKLARAMADDIAAWIQQ